MTKIYVSIDDIKQKLLEEIDNQVVGFDFYHVHGSKISKYRVVDIAGDRVTLIEFRFKDNRWQEQEICYTNIEAFNKHFKRS